MELKAQKIKNGNVNELFVLPYNEFLKLREIVNNYEDLIQLGKAKSEDYNKPRKSPKSLIEELSLESD